MQHSFVRGRAIAWLIAILSFGILFGCAKSEPTVDTAPFESAIADYLQKNDMALRFKKVKEGPAVTDNTATLTGSLTHAELGGPSVTWSFVFTKSANGDWKVVRHEN